MSTLGEPNADAYRGSFDQGSTGPRLGFLDSFDASWNMQAKVQSLLAEETAFRDAEQRERKKLINAGLRPFDSLDDDADENERGGRYKAAAIAIADGGGMPLDDRIKARDKHIEAVRAERPELGLLTYTEMFGEVQKRSKEIAERNALDTTTMGAVGGFLGGALASMDPRTDPINAASVLLTGGASIPARIAVQGLWSGAAEGVNMLLDEGSQRRLIGHDPTGMEQAKRLGFAVAGGAIFQGAGEGVAAGIRRARTGKWFADLPPPPEKLGPPEFVGPREHYGPADAYGPQQPYRMEAGRPLTDYPDWETFARSHEVEMSPHGKTREAVLRTATDLDHVQAELNRWDGPAPWEVAPPMRTDTALPRGVEPGVQINREGIVQRYVDSLDTVDDIARRIDPDLFRTYDKLIAQHAELKAIIDRGREIGDLRPNANRPDVRAAFETERAERETATRPEIQKIDQQMRDLAPLVSRAYGAAEKAWRTTPLDFNTIEFLKKIENGTGWRYRGEGQPSLTERAPRQPKVEPATVAQTVGDVVPLARLTPELESRVKLDANADAPTRVAAAVAEDVKVMDEKVEAFVKTSAKVTKLDANELRTKIEQAQADIAELKQKLASPEPTRPKDEIAEAIKAIEKEIDELTYVTMPDGAKLHMDNDRVPYVDENGNAVDMSVRDFLREMEKDQQALSSVMTCSRPS